MRWFVGWRMHVANALICLTIGASSGYYLRDLQAKAAENARLKDQIKEASTQVDAEHASDAATQGVSEATATRTNEIQYRTRTLIREVPVYVTPSDDGRCIVNNGFVRLHDQAASLAPTVPGGTGELDSAPSGVALSAVASTVVDNYGTCGYYKAVAEGWQSWYNTQQALWGQKDK